MPVFSPSAPTAPAGTFTALAYFRAATTSRNCTVTINWLQASGAPSTIKPTSTSAAAADLTSGWTQVAVTDTAPSDATQATLTVSVASAAASETHYVDCVGLFPGTVTTWTRGGLVGVTTATVTRSDGVVVRGFSSAAIPSGTQSVTVDDYEATPGVTYTYTATVSANIGSGVTVTSTSATSSPADVTASTWWLIDPLTPAATIPLDVIGFPTAIHESLATHYPVGQQYPTVVADVVNGTDGQLQVETQTIADWNNLVAATTSQRIKWLISPYGDGLYIRVGGAGPMNGIPGMVHQTQVVPSSANTPYRQTTLTYVNVARP